MTTTSDTGRIELRVPFEEPYIDIDEWREAPRRRYLHGGFRGTDTRFSLHMPPEEQYDGRFFQYISPVPDSEHNSEGGAGEEDKILFAWSSGAMFLETNGGGPRAADPFSGLDPAIGAYLANASAAEYARRAAGAMYGPHRTYGYAFGGSGGAFRTIGAAENTSGVWDGFVPYVIGTPMAIPNCFTARMHALRVLHGRFEEIVDAVAPGGSGRPLQSLDEEQREAFQEVTAMGFPPRSWFGHNTMGMHGLAALYPGLRAIDPTYFDDFWNLPGYLGADPTSSVHRDRVQHPTELLALLDRAAFEEEGRTAVQHAGTSTGAADDAWLGSASAAVPVAVRVAAAPPVDPQACELVVLDGDAEGARIVVLEVIDDLVVLGPADHAVLAGLQAGDRVVIDNSGFLAMQTYHRHQVPSLDYPTWDQFRLPDGTPRYPQRPVLVGPIFAAATAGSIQDGRFDGRMIVVECLLDREAYAWQADWYRSRVQEHLGAATDQQFRLWMVDNALHGDFEAQEFPRLTVSYLGVLHQALRELAAWVERDIEPAATSAYRVVDGQIVLPEDTRARGGVQPAITLTADHLERAEVKVGEQVRLLATVTDPTAAADANATLEWHDGIDSTRVDLGAVSREQASWTVAYRQPGTYFPSVRVSTTRGGAAPEPFARLQNIASARVVVTD